MEKIIQKNLVIENADIGFTNFAGVEKQYNSKGDRNFVVFLESDLAEALEIDGWNVRYLQPRDEDELPSPYLSVSVRYEPIPPQIMMISGNNKTLLDENTVDLLDYADIANVDVIIRPYNWEVNGKRGVKAYVHTMYVTIMEDEFASKYAHLDTEVSHTKVE